MTIPKDDLISRKALIEVLSEKRMVDVFPDWKDFDDDLRHILYKLGDAFEYEIEAVPTVDAEPVRHGKWKQSRFRNGKIDLWPPTYECSECHYILFGSPRTNFCPDCGAKMVLKEDG